MNKYWLAWQKDLYNYELEKGFATLEKARKYLKDKQKNYKGNWTIIKFTENMR